MRDAFGSTFMFRLIIIFIVVYVTFATIAVSYAKTFRIKNQLIDIVEQNQLDFSEGINQRNSSIIDSFLNDFNYHYGTDNNVIQTCKGSGGFLTDNGACIKKINDSSDSHSGTVYYLVTVYMVVHVPVIDYSVVIPISGRTKDYSRTYTINRNSVSG